jgi:putative membrane protein
MALGLLPVGALALYLAAAARQRRKRWSGWRTLSFVAGIALLVVALSSPLAAWARHDLRGHMLQHLLLGMFAPLALVLAAPLTLLLGSVPAPAARRISALLRSRPVHGLTHPVTALILDVGALYLLHLTPLYAATLSSPALHGAVHFHFFAAGCLFAWAIVGPDPAPRRPRFRTRLLVLLLAIAAHSTLAKIMYAYGWPRGTPHDIEQIRAAAQWMYYGGDLAELLLACALFAAWHRAAGRRWRREQQRAAAMPRLQTVPAGAVQRS